MAHIKPHCESEFHTPGQLEVLQSELLSGNLVELVLSPFDAASGRI